MQEESLIISKPLDNGILLISFNAPHAKNAMTEGMGLQFQELYNQLKNDTSLRCVIITGTGDSFSSGGDLTMLSRLAEMSRDESRKFMRDFYDLYLGIFSAIDVPIIAAVHGAAIGAGFSFVCACDIRVVAREAKLGATFSKIGLYPGMGITCALPRLIGTHKALEHLCKGSVLRGEEWADLGFCSAVVTQEQVLERAMVTAREIAGGSSQAVQQIVRAYRSNLNIGLEEALATEAHNQSICFGTEEYRTRLDILKRKISSK